MLLAMSYFELIAHMIKIIIVGWQFFLPVVYNLFLLDYSLSYPLSLLHLSFYLKNICLCHFIL